MKLTKSNSNDDRRQLWNSCYHLHNLNGVFSLFIFVICCIGCAVCPLPLLNMRLLQIVVPALLECVLNFFFLSVAFVRCAQLADVVLYALVVCGIQQKYVIQLLWQSMKCFSFQQKIETFDSNDERKKGAHNQNYWCDSPALCRIVRCLNLVLSSVITVAMCRFVSLRLNIEEHILLFVVRFDDRKERIFISSTWKYGKWGGRRFGCCV